MNVVWMSGAGGFVGRHLAERLLQDGCRVICLLRSEGAAASELRKLGAEIVLGDLLEPEGFRESLAGVDRIFHLAAAYRDGGTSRADFMRINVDATGKLLEMAAKSGVGRFIYCSTVGVHGDCKGVPLSESAACVPQEEYGRSKHLAEGLVRIAAAGLGLQMVIIRPVGIYGPGDWRLGKLFVSIARKRFFMIGKGNNRYHLTYIDDLVEAFRLASMVPAAVNQTYIIAGDDVPTIKELCLEIARQLNVSLPSLSIPLWPVYIMALLCEGLCRPLGVSPPLFRRRLDFFSKARWFDTAKAKRELGYQPKVGLQDGVTRAIEWYRMKGVLP